MAFSPNGQTLASGSEYGTVRLWDVKSSQHKVILRRHIQEVLSVAFGPDGLTLASGSRDKTVRLWDARTGLPKATLQGHKDPITSVAFSPDGERVFGWDDHDNLLAWTVKDGQPTDPANHPPQQSGKQTISLDGSLRAEAHNNLIFVLDQANSDPQRELAERMVLEETNRIPWHQQQATQTEQNKDWFAAAFHLDQLLKDKPDDAELKKRRDHALDRLNKVDGSNAPRFMEKLP